MSPGRAAGQTLGPASGFDRAAPAPFPAFPAPPSVSASVPASVPALPSTFVPALSSTSASNSTSTPQLKLSLRSGRASSYIFVEAGSSQPWWNRFVRASRLAAAGSRKNSNPARRAPSMVAASHPVVPDVEKPHLGRGPGKLGADPARVAAVAQGPDVDHRHLVEADGFGARMGGHGRAARRAGSRLSASISFGSSHGRRCRLSHRRGSGGALTVHRLGRAHRPIAGPAARSPPAARCARDPWSRERCARPPGPSSVAARRRPCSRPARAR